MTEDKDTGIISLQESVDTLIYYYEDISEHMKWSLQLFMEKGKLKDGVFRGHVDEFHVPRDGHCPVGYFVLPLR